MLLAISGIAGLCFIFLQSRIGAQLGVGMGIAYLTMLGILLNSSSVNAFLEYQRSGGRESPDAKIDRE